MARQQRPERGPVAMNYVVTEALDLAAYPIRTSSIDVVLDLAPDVPAIEADADQLHQVLLNLVINAQQSLQDKAGERRIRIATMFDTLTQTVRVTVADNGPGIPPEVRARVFEPYFTTKPSGTGVGLAVSLGIVEAHGGTLAVDRAPEGGAAFTFVLPVGGAERPPTSEDAVEPDNGLHHAILVVDDEPEIREMLAEILRGADHEVTTAASGREALARIAVERFDVVVTDIRMPDIDGRALFQQIRERWPRLASRVVFVTGDTLTPALREFVTTAAARDREAFPARRRRRIVGDLALGEAAVSRLTREGATHETKRRRAKRGNACDYLVAPLTDPHHEELRSPSPAARSPLPRSRFRIDAVRFRLLPLAVESHVPNVVRARHAPCAEAVAPLAIAWGSVSMEGVRQRPHMRAARKPPARAIRCSATSPSSCRVGAACARRRARIARKRACGGRDGSASIPSFVRSSFACRSAWRSSCPRCNS
jgi:CheY-like chemotaxis protein